MHRRVKGVLEHLLEVPIVLEHPKDKSLGHYASVVAFSLAKTRRKAPKVIALDLVEFLRQQPECIELFSEINALNGYINFTLKDMFLDRLCNEALALGRDFAKGTSNQTLYVEFVSANPTGPLHIGHARGAIFGDSLCRLGRFLGLKTHAEYYVNDMGAQIRMLGLSVYLTLQKMQGVAVHYPENAYKGTYIVELAQRALEHFGMLEGEEDTLVTQLGNFAKDLMLREIQESLVDLGVHMDAYVSEKAMFEAQEVVFDRLQKAGGVYENEGKMWLASSRYGDEKDRVLKKSDSSFTYIAGDITYHDYKFQQNYDHYINIFGADHHGYVARVRAALEFLGYESKRLEVLLAQMVALLQHGKPYKMSKRAGNFVLLRDVLQDIGRDALRFVFLSKKLDTHLEFDVASLQNQDSTNPIFYIHYANARIHTLLGKFLQKGDVQAILTSTLENLPSQATHLLFSALNLPKVLSSAFADRELQKICEYLKNLAGDFHSFYNAHRILDTPEELRYLKLCQMVSLSLTIGLDILGIEAKKKM
ncbi:arginine--tRNA ligase [Helicobacter baculiformis]|uniref:Arginine--tRNA ligase n=1 Tax=Helicobacter baculiformis TaxID=427351 RepID=A0ABV7ZJC6_9HELI|nr:arginine--tRNA ligase [Helicobacter baculiformis]